ncbi:hypothetical protein HY213_04495 [Candidatus Peregrinibacteria bacterium]|nr:hypothetical protein [Candidatus Peregrinibacteria bacterium]
MQSLLERIQIGIKHGGIPDAEQTEASASDRNDGTQLELAREIADTIRSLSVHAQNEILSAFDEGRRIRHEQLEETDGKAILELAAKTRDALRSLRDGQANGNLPQAQALSQEMDTLIRILSQQVPTIALMTGSEALTFRRVKEFEKKNPGALEVTGIVTTTRDLDDVIPVMLGDIPGMNHVQPTFTLRQAPWKTDEKLIGSFHNFSYRHTTAKPGKMYSAEREIFSAEAADHILEINPDVVVLANMMYVLSGAYTKRVDRTGKRSLGTKTFNIHPSVEPELVGANPELRAIMEGNRRATGFTLHALNVMYGDLHQGMDVPLDHGTVLAHQRVPPFCSYNAEERRKIGKPYDTHILEMQRIRTMDASSRWVGPVAALYATATPETMRIMKGRDAFAAEGRLEFYHSEDYEALLRGEYDDWCKKEGMGSMQITFDTWRRTKHPGYQRALFFSDGEFKTAEEILAMPSEADDTIIHPPTQYDFIIGPEKTKEDAKAIFHRFLQLAGGNDGEQMLTHSVAENRDFFEQDNKWLLFGSITTTASIEQHLKAHCSRIDIRVRHLRIGAPSGVAPSNTVRGYHSLLDEARIDHESWAGRS